MHFRLYVLMLSACAASLRYVVQTQALMGAEHVYHAFAICVHLKHQLHYSVQPDCAS